MRFGSILMFGVAFLCAGVAAVLVRAAMRPSGPATIVERPAAMAMKTLLVATRDLNAGERLTAGFVREAQWPAEFIPRGAFSSSEALFAGGQERILSSSIPANEPVLAGRLVDNSDSMAGRLNSGMRGVTIRVNDASSVGGFVQPEDRVDVLMTQTDRQGDLVNGMPRAYTKTLIKNVRVLAADQQTQRRLQAQPPKTVTLEVSEDDAKKLTLAGAIGQLSLTLNKGENSREAGRAINLRDIAALPEDRATPSEEAPVVTIFRSVKREEYRVPQQ